MKYIKTYKIFENKLSMKDDIQDMLLELEDEGMIVEFNNVKTDKKTYEFVISKPDHNNSNFFYGTGYPMFDTSHLVLWGEVKEVVKRITEYVYSNSGHIRFFSDGIEWGVSNSNDFMDQYEGSDKLSQHRLRLLISENVSNTSEAYTSTSYFNDEKFIKDLESDVEQIFIELLDNGVMLDLKLTDYGGNISSITLKSTHGSAPIPIKSFLDMLHQLYDYIKSVGSSLYEICLNGKWLVDSSKKSVGLRTKDWDFIENIIEENYYRPLYSISINLSPFERKRLQK